MTSVCNLHLQDYLIHERKQWKNYSFLVAKVSSIVFSRTPNLAFTNLFINVPLNQFTVID